MLTNGDLYKLLLHFANKESRGGVIRPEDFNLQLRSKNISLLQEKMGIPGDFAQGVPISRQQKGQSFHLDNQTDRFKDEAYLIFLNGVAQLPIDFFKYDSVRTDAAREDVNILHSGQVAKMLKDPIDYPTEEWPVGEFIGNSLTIYPKTIQDATMIYYRKPVDPVFDYIVNDIGEIEYLPPDTSYELKEGEVYSLGDTSGVVASLSVELEWDDPQKLEILSAILGDLGLNLQRQDILQVSNQIAGGGGI